MDKKSFIYAGHSFTGARQWNQEEDFKTISSNIYSQVLNTCKDTGSPFVWNYDEFYREAEKAGFGQMDLFLMDDKFHVIPCGHFLAIYGKADDAFYVQYSKMQGEMYKCSVTKKALMDDLVTLIKNILRFKPDYTWNLKEEGIALSTALYCNGYITADIEKVFIKDELLAVLDGVSDETFTENDYAFTVESLLDIINAFVVN